MLISLSTYRRRCPGIFAVLLLLTAACNAASFGIAKNGKIDQAAITAGYMESEWDQVVQSLEGYLRRHGDNRVSAEERIFAYKFLGVISAADSLTRAKAESYFTRMLRLSPEIEIVDLYPSPRVIEIFKAAKSDYDKFVKYSTRYDNIGRKNGSVDAPAGTSSGPIPSRTEPLNGKTPKPAKISGGGNHAWLWWSLSLATAVGVGAGAYYLAPREKPLKTESSDVYQK